LGFRQGIRLAEDTATKKSKHVFGHTC